MNVLCEQIKQTIQENPVLKDLAKRPLLLVMMLDLFTDQRDIGESNWSHVKLFQSYTEKWLKSEAAKPDSVLRWNEKSALIQEIAWSMYVVTAISSHNRYENITFTQYELSQLLDRFAARYPHLVFSQLVDDICFRSFIIVSDGNHYHFIHKSFQEYYVARYIFDHLKNKEQDVSVVMKGLQEFLTEEVVGLLKEMLGSSELLSHERDVVTHLLIQAYLQNSGKVDFIGRA